MLLAGDAGGTKTVLALYPPEGDPRQPEIRRVFRSVEYNCLEDILEEFIDSAGAGVSAISMGVAGPVTGNRATITNLGWFIDAEKIGSRFASEGMILQNDLAAMANALPLLGRDDLFTLQEGSPESDGPIALIAPGTGLGEAFSMRSGDGFRVCPSEGGHAGFAPAGPDEDGLMLFVRGRLDYVSVESVCSGPGIARIYDYLSETGYGGDEPAWLAEELATAGDRTPIITDVALGSRQSVSKRCEKTVEMFVSILAAEAGNLAVKVLSTGGLYLGGGIPPKVLPFLERGFIETFARKGDMSEILSDMPVKVILYSDAPLAGAAAAWFSRSG